MNQNSQSSFSITVVISILAVIAAGIAGGWADYQGIPLISNGLDWLTYQVIDFIPMMRSLPARCWYLISGFEAAIIVTVPLLFIIGSGGTNADGNKMERRLKRRYQKQRDAHRAGFNE